MILILKDCDYSEIEKRMFALISQLSKMTPVILLPTRFYQPFIEDVLNIKPTQDIPIPISHRLPMFPCDLFSKKNSYYGISRDKFPEHIELTLHWYVSVGFNFVIQRLRMMFSKSGYLPKRIRKIKTNN